MSASMNFDKIKAKYLNEVLPIITGMCTLQFNNSDVAIPVLVGDGGIGKTANINHMCKLNNFNLLDIHYGLIPLEEVSGIPDFAEKIQINNEVVTNTKWTLPDILGKAWKLSANGKPTVVFLDDFHASSPANMALGYEIFTEKKLRGYPFPPNTSFILAMNCSGAKSLSNNIPAPIVNRLAMFKVDVNFEQWKKDFAIPNFLNAKIISFLNNQKNRKYFQQEEQVNVPWSSARSWTKFSTLLNTMEKYLKNVNHADILYYAAAHVGEEAASEFTAYYKIFSEIPTEDIFDRKIEITVPTHMSGQYVFMLATISEFFNRIQDSNVTKNAYEQTINTMCMILIQLGKLSSEIAVTGLKEILLTQESLKLKKIYEKIRTALQVLDMDTFNKIKADIESI